MATKPGITGRINAYFFYQMYVDSQKEGVCNRNAIDWCVKAGLLPTNYECPACKRSMQMKKRNDVGDKWEWSCREDGHYKKRSIRKGTWFENSKMSMAEILLLTWFWMNKYSPHTVMNEIDCASHTVSDWYSFCREVCIEVCLKSSEKIGGDGRVVEFEESKFGKRKHSKGKHEEEGGKWVYVGIERETDKCFFVVKPVRSKESLYHVLRDWILPETTVMTDCWSVYDCLEDEDFQVLKDLNGLAFKNPDIGGHSNAVEGSWSGIKRGLKGLSQFKDQFDGHLAEYMWRRQNNIEIQRQFVAFIEAIKSIYPPQTADV